LSELKQRLSLRYPPQIYLISQSVGKCKDGYGWLLLRACLTNIAKAEHLPMEMPCLKQLKNRNDFKE
jgi:hypothetical protein